MTDTTTDAVAIAAAIREGRTSLGIEFGSTRIKACLVGENPSDVLAVGSHEWENQFVDRVRVVRGHEHDRRRLRQGSQGGGEVESRQPRHVDVEEGGGDRTLGEQPQRLGTR